MSNIAIGYPNRLLELNKIHNGTWVDNYNSPLSKIQTPILAEVARTSDFPSTTDKKVSFGLSLKNVPYRTFGVVALLNHNLSVSAKVRFSVFNAPPIVYAKSALSESVAVADTLILTLDTPQNLIVGQQLKLYGYSSEPNSIAGEWVYVTVSTMLDSSNITVTRSSTHIGSGSYKTWIVFSMDATEAKLQNAAKWQDMWKRVSPSNSPLLTWHSTNFWRGTVDPDLINSYTKTHISFLKNPISLNQCVGTHLHIDICDNVETVNTDSFIKIGRVFIGQYTQPAINPEYGTVEHNFIDNSEISASNSGTEYFYEKQKARSVSIQWNHLTEDEAFGQIYEASRSQGLTREVLYVFDPDDEGAYQYIRSFIGRFTQLNALTIPNVGLYGASINLKEIL